MQKGVILCLLRATRTCRLVIIPPYTDYVDSFFPAFFGLRPAACFASCFGPRTSLIQIDTSIYVDSY